MFLKIGQEWKGKRDQKFEKGHKLEPDKSSKFRMSFRLETDRLVIVGLGFELLRLS